MRGFITSGEQWLFFIYGTTENGGLVSVSTDEYSIGSNFENLALVLGLLQDWVSLFFHNASPRLNFHLQINNTTNAESGFFTRA
jgi:hypothetical protein